MSAASEPSEKAAVFANDLVLANTDGAASSGSKMSSVDAAASGNAAKGDLATENAGMLYSEDLSVGDCWTTDLRRISEQDVRDFAGLTGDHTPLHAGNESSSPFGRPVVHGLLGLSVLAGLGTSHPNVATLALVALEDWQFLAPVFFGDAVKARNEIISIERHGRRAIKVRWLRQLTNGIDRVLQQGHFVTLVGSRERVVDKPR